MVLGKNWFQQVTLLTNSAEKVTSSDYLFLRKKNGKQSFSRHWNLPSVWSQVHVIQAHPTVHKQGSVTEYVVHDVMKWVFVTYMRRKNKIMRWKLLKHQVQAKQYIWHNFPNPAFITKSHQRPVTDLQSTLQTKYAESQVKKKHNRMRGWTEMDLFNHMICIQHQTAIRVHTISYKK